MDSLNFVQNMGKLLDHKSSQFNRTSNVTQTLLKPPVESHYNEH